MNSAATSAAGLPFEEAVLREQSECMRSEIDSLSKRQRDVIDLVFYQGLKYREAARVLGVPVGTVKSRLNAAFKRLRHSCLRTYNPSKDLAATTG